MIQITAIPRLDPYHRSRPLSDFTSCPHCGQVYQSAYRSMFCPHAMGPARQIGAGTAAPLVRKRKPSTQVARPRVLVEPYYLRQPGESDKRWTAFSLWLHMEDRRFAKVARALQKSHTIIQRWATEDKWTVRVEAYDAEQRLVEQKTLRKRWEQRTKQAQVLLDNGLLLLASEYKARIKELKRAMAGDISTETLLKYTIELGKMVELLQGRATEHVIHDTPDMIRERKFRDAVLGAQELIAQWKAVHADVSPEDIAEWESNYVSMVAARYEIDPKELESAVLGTVDDSSTATN